MESKRRLSRMFDRRSDPATVQEVSASSEIIITRGHQRVWPTVGTGALIGALLALFWSFYLVDEVIGGSLARTMLGADAKGMDLGGGGSLLGLAFALVAGIAGTFTACNCVVFSCMAPLSTAGGARTSVWRSLGYMAVGVVSVTSLYGALATLFPGAIPTLSGDTLNVGEAGSYPLRLAQASTIFVTLGLIFVWWGLHKLNLAGNPLARWNKRWPWFEPLMVGVMVGFFTVGRPYPMFQKALASISTSGNPIFGAGALALHGLGNILLMSVLLLLLTYGTAGRFERWVHANPARFERLSSGAMIAGGVFFLVYWGIRVPSYFGIGWFPHLPYR